MTEAEPPPAMAPRKRTSFETQRPFGSGAQPAAIALYGLLTLVLGGTAIYGAAIAHYPLTSGYVAAPAIGALWFALRLFMMLSARK